MDDVIILIAEGFTTNEYGVQIPTETETQVFAHIDSVTASEFFEGGRNGLNPDFRMRLFRYDYDGQRVVCYNGRRYAVYRTYAGKNDTIELYVERKGGTNGGS